MSPLERRTLFALCLVMWLTPGMWIRHAGGYWGRKARKAWVECYSVIKIILALAILFTSAVTAPWIAIFVFWLLVDDLVYVAGYLFFRNVWRTPYSWNRSVLLLFLNFIEYTAWFACIYTTFGLLRCDKIPVTFGGDAWYFSVVTAATVGYGDITPTPGIGHAVVMLEIGTSLFFMGMAVAYFISNVNAPDGKQKF